MSNSYYHEFKQKYTLQAAWYVVTEALQYEETWDKFHQEFPGVEVEIKIQKVVEVETNYSEGYDAEIECVQFAIKVTNEQKQEYEQALVLDDFGVRCIDRFNYPKGFRIPDPAYFQYKYERGIHPIPKKNRAI